MTLNTNLQTQATTEATQSSGQPPERTMEADEHVAMGRMAAELLALPAGEEYQRLVEHLASEEPSRQKFAEVVLCHLGSAVVPNLIGEAALQRKRRRYCVRLLGVIEKIGAPLPAGDWFALVALSARGYPQVRAAAARLMRVLGPPTTW